MMNEDFLTTSEKQSPLWAKLKRMMVSRIERSHIRLEGSLSDADTNKARGRILELRSLIALDEDDPAVE